MIKTTLRAVAAAALLTMTAGAHAAVAQDFKVNPNSNGLTNDGMVFSADQVSGVSSARVTYLGNNRYQSIGYIQYQGFALNGQTINVDDTKLNSRSGYGLYATFDQTFSCSAMLSPGVSCSIDTIELSLYGDPESNNIYNQATLTNNATVTAVGSQVLLGTVDTVIDGEAGLNTLGGAFQNVNTNFKVTAAGQLYFIEPNPFYNFAFSAFNNSSQGLLCSNGVAPDGAPPSSLPAAGNPALNPCIGATVVAINQESGTTDFNGGDVPEPGALALMGVGLLGMTAYRRKRKQK